MVIVLVMLMGMTLSGGIDTESMTKQTDTASITSAVSDHYRRFGNVPFEDAPLKTVIGLDTELHGTYTALVEKFGEKYVDENMFMIDLDQLKAAKSLVRVMDSTTKWVGDKNDPTFMMSVGGETSPEGIPDSSSNTAGVDKPLDKRKVEVVVVPDLAGRTIYSADMKRNNIIIGASGTILDIKYQKNSTDNMKVTKYVVTDNPTYVRKSRSIQFVTDTGKINTIGGN